MVALLPSALLAGLLLMGSISAAAAQVQTDSAALPQAGDLTLAAPAGSVLIGLTVRPAMPGPNTLLVYVMPLAGPAAAVDVQVDLLVNGSEVPLQLCSRNCRTADVDLQGGEHIDLMASNDTGGTASFDLPTFPAPDGTSLLDQEQARMRQLKTYRIDEALGPADPPAQTAYTYQAPNRTRVEASNGFQMVWVGTTRYSRRSPGENWQVDDAGIALPVPTLVWDTRRPTDTYVGAHILGVETRDGVDTRILGFLLNAGRSPYWFRLWVDADGLVHRAEMRGQGHFMDQDFSAFDEPLTVDVPTA